MDEEAKRKKRKTKGMPNMGIKIQKGDKYFGSGRAVGFAAADGGIKKTVYKNERPDSRPQKIVCLIVFGRVSLRVLWEIATPGRKRGCNMRTKYEQNILLHCFLYFILTCFDAKFGNRRKE